GSKDTLRHPGAGSGTALAHARSLLDAGRAVRVQPYLAAVDRDGETGLVLFDGELSDAVRKGPLHTRGGEAPEGLLAGGEISPRRPEPDEVEVAQQVQATACRLLGVEALAYARVDLLRDDAGPPVLLELELTEPSFFRGTDPDAAARAAACFAR